MRAAWPAAVGADVARRTACGGDRRGVLRIKVPDPRWQRTLLRMRARYCRACAAVAGDAAPRALGFVVGPVPETAEPTAGTPARPEMRHGRRRRLRWPKRAGWIPDADVRARFLEVAGDTSRASAEVREATEAPAPAPADPAPGLPARRRQRAQPLDECHLASEEGDPQPRAHEHERLLRDDHEQDEGPVPAGTAWRNAR